MSNAAANFFNSSLSIENSTKGHTKARLERPPSYPARFPVPEEKVCFAVEWAEYSPPEYSRPSSGKDASDSSAMVTADFAARFEQGGFKSFEREVNRDPGSGRPLNVRGRTGLTGLGSLYYWGANTAADCLVLRHNGQTHEDEVLLIQRQNGQWALPGGFYKNERSQDAAVRELEEETSVSRQMLLKAAVKTPRIVYQGYADDPRNTDNAWIETTAWMYLVDYAESSGWTVKGGDDAREARWFPIREALAADLYAGHREYLISAVRASCTKEPMASQDRQIRELSILVKKGVKRLGIYGGSFDPLHAGHIEVGQLAERELGLDAVLFIPAKRNPFKEASPGACDKQRLEMLNSALNGFPSLYVSDIELRRNGPGPSFTIDTIRSIRQELNLAGGEEIKLFLILGSDNIPTFSKWNGYQAIGKLAHTVFQARGKVSGSQIAEWRKQLDALRLEKAPIILCRPTRTVSSTELRGALARGDMEAAGMLPEVAAVLKRNNPYGAQLRV